MNNAMDQINTFFRKYSSPVIYTIVIFVFIVVFILIELFFDSFFPKFNDYSRYFFKALVFVIVYEPLHSLLEKQFRKILIITIISGRNSFLSLIPFCRRT